jgi:TRAP transporter TAXI family solute receptor
MASCSRPRASAPLHVRIAGGPRDATFFILASAFASMYSQRLPGLSVEALETRGTTENIDAVDAGDAECGLGSADLVYNARLRGTSRTPEPHRHLRGVAVLFPNTLHLVTRADSGLVTLADLAGRRVAAAIPGDVVANRPPSTRLDGIGSAVAQLARAHTPPITPTVNMDEAVGALERREIDAANFYGGDPFRPVTQAADRYAIHFVEFDDLAVSLVKAKNPFLKAVVIPPRTYAGQPNAVRTVAIDNVLICHAGLAPDIVYNLTRTLFDGLPSLASVHASARQINPENGASTPIPLHEGAARYYRERELFR